MNFFITVYGVTEEEAHGLWVRHKTDKIHCLMFEGKAHISGEATKEQVSAIIEDIKDMSKEYGLISEDLM